MRLALPALALGIEGDIAVELHPRHVYPEEALPLGVALRGGELRLFIDYMLEMIDHRAVGYEGDGSGEMGIEELPLVVAEEALRPGPCEELHAHGVHLAGLHARPCVLEGDAPAVEPEFEGVAGLVGDDLDVALRAVEVCEDEGRFIGG